MAQAWYAARDSATDCLAVQADYLQTCGRDNAALVAATVLLSLCLILEVWCTCKCVSLTDGPFMYSIYLCVAELHIPHPSAHAG